MEDLFEYEQRILEDAQVRLEQARAGEPLSPDDYAFLLKEYRRMLRHLRRIVKVSDKTANELNNSKNSLFEKAQRDGLTGLYNRRFLDETLAEMHARLSQEDRYIAVFMLDVDHFKKYNDAYGHGAGDECLAAIAKLLKIKTYEQGDQGFAARYGGEEFLIVLPDVEEKEARSFSEGILTGMKELGFVHEGNPPSNLTTISIGAVALPASAGSSAEEFLAKADEALYMSKRGGRDRVTFLSLEVKK